MQLLTVVGARPQFIKAAAVSRAIAAHAVGIEQQQRQPLRGRLRLHPRVKPLLATGILGLSGDQDLGAIQLIHQIQQDIHLVVV